MMFSVHSGDSPRYSEFWRSCRRFNWVNSRLRFEKEEIAVIGL